MSDQYDNIERFGFCPVTESWCQRRRCMWFVSNQYAEDANTGRCAVNLLARCVQAGVDTLAEDAYERSRPR